MLTGRTSPASGLVSRIASRTLNERVVVKQDTHFQRRSGCRLSDNDVIAIRLAYSLGCRPSAIGAVWNCKPDYISRVVDGTLYARVPDAG